MEKLNKSYFHMKTKIHIINLSTLTILKLKTDNLKAAIEEFFVLILVVNFCKIMSKQEKTLLMFFSK